MDFLVAPWEHQKIAIERASDLPYFALFFEQGCGKTSTLINILRKKYAQEKKPLRTLILCPPIVIDNWKREFSIYSRIPEDKIVPLTNTVFNRLHRLEHSDKNSIFVTNYQSLLMDKVFKKFLEMQFEVVVLDESHKIKTYNTKTTKQAIQLGKRAKYRYILSGTPVLNTVSDLFPQILFLDGGKTLGTNFAAFREEYFVDFNLNMPCHVY